MLSMRRSAQLGLVVSCLILFFALSVLAVQARQNYLPGTLPPAELGAAFHLRGPDGSSVASQQFRGRTTVLYFTSLRCPVTQEYNQRMSELARRYAGNAEVAFVAIECADASAGDVTRDAHAAGRTFPTALDPSGGVARAYGVRVTPTLVILDPAGMVRYHGAFDDDRNAAQAQQQYCDEAIRYVLRGRQPTVSSTQAFGCRINGTPK